MFRESNFDSSASRAAPHTGILRHPDGSIDFDAYREKARLARRAAIAASIRTAFWLVASALAGKPVAATHQPHHAT